MLLIGTFFYGQHVEKLAWEAKVAEMNLAMEKMKSQHDLDVANLNAALEKEHGDHQHDIDQKNGELSGIASELDRLRAVPKACGGNQVPSAAKPPAASSSDSGKPSDAVPGMAGSFQELNAIMAQCFATAEYAREAHRFVTDQAVSGK